MQSDTQSEQSQHLEWIFGGKNTPLLFIYVFDFASMMSDEHRQLLLSSGEPGRSACCTMYAECLWYPENAIVRPLRVAVQPICRY